mmetsp:Transcript_15267/g.27752  ORF Transcript_15267/g.27752 Transcript_15267/m.27752 type:complete len:352 (-) Transcript_15267:342-1397(-)
MSPTPKRLRSQDPDVVVAVGQGDAKKEFECYRIALSFASPYFDTMFSVDMAESNNSRIEFPDKDPAEWELFYSFIDPSQISEARHDAVINEENVMVLTPWFHEFQMKKYLTECDRILADKVLVISKWKKSCKWDESFWEKDSDRSKSRMGERRTIFNRIIELLQFACVYDLKGTKRETEATIQKFMTWSSGTVDLFDLASVKTLVDLFLPLEEADSQGREHLTPRGRSTCFWETLSHDFRNVKLSTLSAEAINNNSEMLPLLVYTSIQEVANAKRACEIKNSAESVVNKLVKKCPNLLYACLVEEKSVNGFNIEGTARAHLKKIMYNQFKSNQDDYKNLMISVPETYTNDY